VKEAVRGERLNRLQTLLDAQATVFNEGTLGRTLPVLLERPGRHPGQLVGRSPYLQAVHVAAPDGLLGRVARVTITGCHRHSLAGRMEPHGPITASNGIPAQPEEVVA
jgi:tRNA-2-methylthio-N6-dimethylallyladenosine synthase